MTKKKAIKILIKQKEKLNADGVLSNLLWLNQSKSYINEIFGTDSSEMEFIKTFRIYPDEIYFLKKNIKQTVSDNIELLKKFMDDCIEVIKDKGPIKKLNFLQRLSDTALWALITLLATAIFSTGFWFGSHDNVKKENNNNQNPQSVVPDSTQKTDTLDNNH